MTDTREMKAMLVRKGMTVEKTAKLIGISPQSMSYKLNNKREFTGTEIMKISEVLGLTNDEVFRIFFTDKVEKSATE